jgi:hypothetical protein
MDSIEQRPNAEDVEKAMQCAREMLSRAQRKKGTGKVSGA